MLIQGPAKKVTIFVNEDTQHHMTALHDSIMKFLMHKGVNGATATRAFSGFGLHQALHKLSRLKCGPSICPSGSNSKNSRESGRGASDSLRDGLGRTYRSAGYHV